MVSDRCLRLDHAQSGARQFYPALHDLRASTAPRSTDFISITSSVLWITPAGYVLIYYFLPLSVRNPLYAHKLSLVGFWSLALFYPFVGIHHYLYSPIADWAETLAIITSMLLIIPVWTVLVNFFGTVKGRWREFGRNLPAKFLIMGSLMYLFGCFQGSTEALRSIQQPTHFTDFVISHSHLTVFGTFVVWAMGGLIYVWPRMCGRELWSSSSAIGRFG